MRTLCCLLMLLVTQVQAAETSGEWISLFNGTDLTGWTGDPKLWSVENGTIVGSTEGVKLTHNTFLSTKDTYDNFVLKLKFKLRNHNSGVQFRSKQFDNYVVKGYQADIADKRYMGILYEEGGRGILVDVKPDEVAKHVKLDDWNEYTITADGSKITQEINGFKTVEYVEKGEGATSGIIAFQLHQGPEMKVYFKDVQIKPLGSKK